MVQRAHPAAATALDPTAMPRGKKAAAAPPASCELGQVASLKGLRWARKAAEDKASAKALRDAKRDAKRAVRAERGAEKLGRQAGKGGAKDAGGGLRRRAAGELLTAAATYEAVGAALRAAHATHVFATLPAAGASGGAGKSGAAAAAELLATFEARRAAHLVRADALAREAWADAPPPASPRASPRAPGELARAWCAAPVESPRSPRLEFQAPDLARASS